MSSWTRLKLWPSSKPRRPAARPRGRRSGRGTRAGLAAGACGCRAAHPAGPGPGGRRASRTAGRPGPRGRPATARISSSICVSRSVNPVPMSVLVSSTRQALPEPGRAVSRARLYKTEAIVLRMDLGEADGRAHPAHSAARQAAGHRQGHPPPARSRLGGGLEPFSDVHLVLAVGRTFDVVTQVALEDPHLGLRNDLIHGWRLVPGRAGDRFCEDRPTRTRPSCCWPRGWPRWTPPRPRYRAR